MQDETGRADWEVNWMNDDVPTEVFVMKMRAFLDAFDEAYFKSFRANDL